MNIYLISRNVKIHYQQCALLESFPRQSQAERSQKGSVLLVHVVVRVQLVDQRLHHVGILLVELKCHRVGLEGLLLPAKLFVNLAHCHVNRSLLRAKRLQDLEHLETLPEAI